MTTDNVTSIYQGQNEAEDAFAALVAARGGGNGGGGDMFEKRLDKLDGKVDQIDVRLNSIDVTLAKIDSKLDSKPGTWAVLALNATLIGLLLAAIGFGARIL